MVLELGWLAANPGYKPASEGTEIRVWSNGLHTDFMLPIRSNIMDWAEFAPYSQTTAPAEHLKYVVLGWGDRGFYIGTPTYDDFSITTALKAIFLPTDSVMHVSYQPFLPEPSAKCVRIVLSDEQYQRFVHFLKSSFALGEQNQPARIAGASYGTYDAFFEGAGNYHLFRTCNNWANQALQTTGVTTPIWSPFEYAIFDHVKNQ
jgi:uncharacterized protein (TIGR02117 family)